MPSAENREVWQAGQRRNSHGRFEQDICDVPAWKYRVPYGLAVLDFRAVLELSMETEVKHCLCQDSLAVGGKKLQYFQRTSLFSEHHFSSSWVFGQTLKYLTWAVPVAYSLQMLAAGRVHSQLQSFLKWILKVSRFARVNNYLYDQRFQDQTFIIIIVLKDKSTCSPKVLLIPILNLFGKHTVSNPPKQTGIQEKYHLMSFWEIRWLLWSYICKPNEVILTFWDDDDDDVCFISQPKFLLGCSSIRLFTYEENLTPGKSAGMIWAFIWNL